MVLIVFDRVVGQLNSLKYLKVAYSVMYLLVCVLFSLVHYVKYSSSSYAGQLISLTSLNLTSLRTLAHSRGLTVHSQSERSNLEEVISFSGAVFESELSPEVGSKTKVAWSRTFNSAGEFLESVEDSRESVWLVHIVKNDDEREFNQCSNDSTRFVSNSTWHRLNSHLSKFGILTGTFNCAHDEYFCRIKGWHEPQLVLGLLKYDLYRSPKEFVQFHTYKNCQRNDYDSVFRWVRYRLEKADRPPSSSTDLQVYYLQNKSTKLPLYYSAISFKYSKRVRFQVISDLKAHEETKTCLIEKGRQLMNATPIYLVVGGKYCYNYGSHLNELPSYIHLNHFLLFLYPDMNCIFMISFFFLNSLLFLVFFEYNTSLVRQLLRGFSYLLLFNLILFSIWLLTINTSSKQLVHLAEFIDSYFLSRLLVWFRFIATYNDSTRFVAAACRFFTFYYIYVNPYLLLINYCIFCMLFYAHTWYNFRQAQKKCILPIQRCSANKNRNARQCLHNNNRIGSQSSLRTPFLLATAASTSPDIDVDISVSELINQINGVTSIWLQSSTHADRLIAELPSIEYCKCMDAAVRRHRRRDGERVSSSSENDDENDTNLDGTESTAGCCRCGKNDELKAYMESQQLNELAKFRSECSICLEKYSLGSFLTLFPCGHLFHRKCIYEWFMNSANYKCPVCRTSFYKFKKSI